MTELANSMRPKGYITFRARALRPQCVIGTSLASGVHTPATHVSRTGRRDSPRSFERLAQACR